ncbi:S1 family peptidase [Streptomyces sp. NBC_00286]|uniref:S1 family peptidase n=1 Tax=Streptomyces sp. NBC_00286 TaxID=2975701 RepID=UPI002E2A3CAB|nr:S1 family peptidase [Streptomyces sp. NBC_00286]
MSARHDRPGRTGRRAKVGMIAGGAAVVLAAGVGIAAPGGSSPDDTTPGTSLEQPGQIDPEGTYQTAVDYLVESGMDREAAEARMRNQQRYVKTAEKLRAEAPDDIQSAYIDGDGELVVNVLTDKGGTLASDAGATPRQVSSSWEELTEIRQQLLASAGGEAGMTVGINPKSGKVEVAYSSSGKAVARLLAKAEQYGDAVTVTKKAGTLQRAVDVPPGQQITIGGQGCTAGWGVDIEDLPGDPRTTTTDGLITAGHCLNADTPVQFKGKDAGTAFDIHDGADGDYGFVELNQDHSSVPNLAFVEEPVIGIQRTMIVGTVVCKLGVTTDETCGEIEAVNESVEIPNPDGTTTTYNGMVKASMCVKGGDSGAPVYTFAGDVTQPGAVLALGIAGSGNNINGQCGEEVDPKEENESHFQPIDIAVPEGGPYELKLAGSGGGGSGSS